MVRTIFFAKGGRKGNKEGSGLPQPSQNSAQKSHALLCAFQIKPSY